MRAINTITATRPSLTNWHLAVAFVLAVCALALPATASARPYQAGGIGEPGQSNTDTDNSSVNSITGSSYSGETSGSSGGYSSVNAIAPPAPSEPTLVSSPPSSTDDGFEWLSAAIGAAAAMGLLALGAAALLTVRRRTTVSAAR